MNLNIESISKNSNKVYRLMTRMYHYTFNELQRICLLEDTALCLAIVRLVQEGKVVQAKGEQGVYYMVVEWVEKKGMYRNITSLHSLQQQ